MNQTKQGKYFYKQGGGFLDVDPKAAVIKGYLNVMEYTDSSRDVISATAWNKTIKERGPEGANRLRYCLQHDIEKPINKFKELYVENNQLKYVVEVSERLQGIGYIKDTLTLIEEGVLDENSVGFQVLRGKYNEDKDVYEMYECALFEGSVVTLADNDMSIITEFNYDEEKARKMANRVDAMIKMLKSGNVTDETMLQLQAKLLKLKTDIALAPDVTDDPPKPLPEEVTKLYHTIKELGANYVRS